VLESSATKRDAKTYLQTFGSKGSESKKTPAFTTVLSENETRDQSSSSHLVKGPEGVSVASANEVPHIAIVKVRQPQEWDNELLDGVAKTLTRLRDLGLRSVIVPDCDLNDVDASHSKQIISDQTDRLIRAISRHSSPGAELVTSAVWKSGKGSHGVPTVASSQLFVGFGSGLTAPLRHGHILVVPPRAFDEDTLKYTHVNADDVICALTRYFTGLQFDQQKVADGAEPRPDRKALVDRIIVIDPAGGIPALRDGDGARVFVNLEEEFDKVQAALAARGQAGMPKDTGITSTTRHAENLTLAKKTLAILPPTSSAIITSPAEAANRKAPQQQANDALVSGGVKTRRWQNPLIHNLITDRPIYSASLPIGRIKSSARRGHISPDWMPTTTLAKKGLPVTIFPDTRNGPWTPPKPGGPRLRLTDTCIDLPRLVHLINDSFNRQLDVEHYLRRVENDLAGVIIAGQYEGGAILTWERPFGLDHETAYATGRLVPYLDKFAVLKRSQGAGGVADIVFNAMVRDCFPDGVCWRSRKNNPVNKWYFERSCGVRKLPDSNWAMFWTTPEAATSEQIMQDYEDVCRNIEPSWADTKPAD
jgi:amino-acid N-acetyltransferase